jgi:hypothetical protein
MDEKDTQTAKEKNCVTVGTLAEYIAQMSKFPKSVGYFYRGECE